MSDIEDINKRLERGETDKALRLAKAEASRRPKDVKVLDLLARCYTAAGDYKFALGTYDRLSRLVPNAVGPLADKALLLQQTGDRQGAETALRRALKILPLEGALLRMLGATARLDPEDPQVAPIAQAWQRGRLAGPSRIQAGFALGKIYGPRGLPYLAEANHLQRQAFPWDISRRRKEVDGLKASMSARPWPVVKDAIGSQRPILVTGMPRSGTTLIEHILSCHPTVTAAGETGLTTRAVYSVLADKNVFRPVSALASADLATIGQRYLQGMEHFHRPGPVFTDKSIQSYMVMGLMHYILPQLRTIVVRRDPRDIGWSIYRNYFENGSHRYSNELSDIGRYIRMMEDMLEFWRRLRPEAFIEVRYEDLVRAQESETRRILEYCGLDWNAACLAPEANARAVKTLSVEQVRAPVSDKAVGGWRAYADHLAPLIDELGDLCRPWD